MSGKGEFPYDCTKKTLIITKKNSDVLLKPVSVFIYKKEVF